MEEEDKDIILNNNEEDNVTNPSDLSSKGPIYLKRSKEFGRARRSTTRMSRSVKRFPKQLSIIIALTNKLVGAYH